MPLYLWSETASQNASGDPTINWAEGQPPSSVNDSARALMAAVAQYRDDIAGSIITAGTATAYTVASNSVFDTLAHLNGQMVAFTPHTTNGAGSPSVTLSVDGLTAKPIRAAPNVDIPSGTIIQGTPYVATYNNSDGAFYLQGFFGNPYNIPVGAGFDYWGTTGAPNSSFAFPYGQAISRTVYATAFAIFGTTYGVGDGTTTFNLPDKRGRATVSLDNMGGTPANRITAGGSGISGVTIGASGGAETYTQQRSDLPNVAPSFTGTSGTVNVSGGNAFQNGTPIGGVSSGAGGLVAFSGGSFGPVASTGSFTPQGSVQSLNGNVTQTAMKTVLPAIVAPYVIRII